MQPGSRNSISYISRRALAAVALGGISMLAGPTVTSADPHDGYGVKCEERHDYKKGKYKYECKGKGYQYEYKEDQHGYKEQYQGGPPPWAPAHGYRRKHKQEYAHAQEHYPDEGIDFGIPRGRCDRQLVGGLLGGAAGGAIGSQIGKGDGRLAATAAGALLGYIVGSEIGRSMDEADRYCTGQVLERANERQTVAWTNPDTRTDYQVTPVKTYESQGRYCREYVTYSEVDGRTQQVYGKACRQPDGSWQIVK